VPRPDRFEPPGPVLAPDRQRRLFGLIGEVATATGQAMPREVYLVPDVNAWVAVRGGVMGFGSRRVMGPATR
jgi:heat shock protein HtpX